MLRTPKCSRCRNHGYLVPVKGHAGKCRWKQCICDKCYLITERQKIMAAQKVLKTQASEEQATVSTQEPQLPPGAPVEEAAASSSSSICPLPPATPGGAGRGAGPGPVATCFLERPRKVRSPGPSAFQLVPGGRPGPSTFHSGLGASGGPHDRPSAWLPQVSSQASRPEPCGPEQRLPMRPVARLPFTDYGHPLRFSSDHVGGAGYLEREPFNQCPACVPLPSYQPFLLDSQDASSALGIPQQRSFRHVSYSPYHGGSLVTQNPVSEPGRDLQPTYCSPPPPLPPPPSQLQQPHFLPAGYLSALHFLPLPPPPPSPQTAVSLAIMYDTDKDNTDDQGAEALSEPSRKSSQEKSN